jgi:NarL family two-component system response regulator LiaR
MKISIRVLIADDHEIVRKGIRALLEAQSDIQVIGEARDGAEAIAQTQALQPDVILMDLVMPKLDGIEATKQITAKQPGTRVLVLTSFAADDKAFPAIKAGALGYLLKDSGPRELVQAIHQVYRGEPSLAPIIARKLLSELSTSTTARSHSGRPMTTDPLSVRELDTLRLIAQGKNNRDIAQELSITEMTVRSHVSNILGKLHLASRTQAALYALKEGIVSLEDIPNSPEE